MSIHGKEKKIAMKCVDKARYIYEHLASYFKNCLYKRELQPRHNHLFSMSFTF